MKNDKIKLIIEIIIFIFILAVITFVYYFGGSDMKSNEESGDVQIVKITNDNFEEEVLKSEKPVILEFSSNSCPPCITMVSTMMNIAKNNDDIKVGIVNSDNENTSKLLEEYNIEAYPTIIIFNNGEVQKVFLGVTSEDTLLEEVK